MAEMQKDLVLNINEYAYVLDKTKGSVSCAVGPYKTSLSQSDALVTFNEKTKKFEECTYNDAIKLFITAPENWYVILKNPIIDNKFPLKGTSNMLPDGCEIGKKININGPISFALYPGQMAKVIRGHILRSNQYLLARVYNAESANNNQGMITTISEDSELPVFSNNYANGQLLIIKGTEVSFYIPPTGIEVVPIFNDDEYVREAVTLERLEYCILKDEDGNKRYIHGPNVVFPKPTESFIENENGFKFKAIELSKISGIFVKVIAEYTEKGITHPIGEELFITGNDQMIYYPRPEHTIIDYEGKILHHAIAIPSGEGRYLMNRMTGDIRTIKGPDMYLPDPRSEVIVKRKLSAKQCNLWYPGNDEVLKVNSLLSEEQDLVKEISYEEFSMPSNKIVVEGGISRTNKFSKPRTITIDNKYDGVITISVWTGYAINVISKNSERKIIAGPKTYLMEYDETLEVLELSTGKPKSNYNLLRTVYLRVENNKISDIISIQTKDFVNIDIKVSYCVDFVEEYKEKWFSIENYVKYLCDRMRSVIKHEAKKYSIGEFYSEASGIINNVVLNTKDPSFEKYNGRIFKENGMLIHDVEVLSVTVEEQIARIIEEHQEEMIKNTLELSDASKKIDLLKKLSEIQKVENELKYDEYSFELKLSNEYELEKIAKDLDKNRLENEVKLTSTKAEFELQTMLDKIQLAKLERANKENEQKLAYEKAKAKLEEESQKSYAQTVQKIMEAFTPDLIASMTSQANKELLSKVTNAMSPYAIAEGESVVEVTDKLLRGTTLEGIIENITKIKKND